MKKLSSLAESYALPAAFTVVLVYLSPLVIYGQDAIVPVRDVLDSCITLYKVLVESGTMFAPSNEPIPAVMNGLPRGSIGPEFHVLPLLFSFFHDYAAHTINEVIVHIVAFWGMYVFLRTHVVREEGMRLVHVSVSMLFALLPFFAYFSLAIAGMPLLANAFLNIRGHHDGLTDWLVVVVIPFYTFFPSVGIFFAAALVAWLALDVILTRTFPMRFAAAVAIHILLCVAVEYRLFFGVFLGDGFVSHRLERWYQTGASVGQVLARAGDMLINGQFHAASLHTWYIPLIILALGAGWWKMRGRHEVRVLTGVMAGIIAIAAFHGFWFWEGLDSLKAAVPFIRTFQFDRFYMFNPLLWYVALACASVIIAVVFRRTGKYLVVLTVVFHLKVMFDNNPAVTPIRHAVKQVLLNISADTRNDPPTYRQFFSASLFREIDRHIGRPKDEYRVVSIGIHPAIAQYSGFYTLDGYFGNYPLSYKHQFRRIIAAELEKNEGIRKDFDHWGNKAYVYVSELSTGGARTMYAKTSTRVIKDLALNTAALKEMNCAYVFSAVPILNAAANGMELVREFENDESYWRIFLYSLL